MEPRAIERAAAAAWPSTETEERDGWLLRSTPGLERNRSNTALPLVADADPAVVESWYAERSARPLVQVTPLEERGALDRALLAAGWEELSRVDVLVAPAGGLDTPSRPVTVLPSCTPRWLDAWAVAEDRDDVAAHAELVLRRLPPGRAAYALALGGVAVGLAVLTDGGACGLFCLATRREARRQGLGTAVLGALGEWARGVGASTLYLQVLTDNAVAKELYRRAGFVRSHGYVHRGAPVNR